MDSHVEYEHDLLIKTDQPCRPEYDRIYLASTHDLFINRLVVSSS